MKQTLSARLGQRLAMTPQMRQSVKLMQLSTPELQQAVLDAVERNPLLELAEDDATEDDDAPAAAAVPDEMPRELAVDVSWDDVHPPSASRAAGASETRDGFLERASTGASLRDDLLWQLNLAPLSERQRFVALVVVDGVDEDGMLRATAEELLATLGPDFTAADLRAAVRVVQGFDPPGVGARDLRECLLLQLGRLPAETPWRAEAMAVVDDHLPLVAQGDSATLARRAGLREADLPEALALIRTLQPRPGAAVGDTQVDYIEPDVIVRKTRGRWTVELNRALVPSVRVHKQYASHIKAGDNSADNLFLRDNLREAQWFLKNLETATTRSSRWRRTSSTGSAAFWNEATKECGPWCGPTWPRPWTGTSRRSPGSPTASTWTRPGGCSSSRTSSPATSAPRPAERRRARRFAPASRS